MMSGPVVTYFILDIDDLGLLFLFLLSLLEIY